MDFLLICLPILVVLLPLFWCTLPGPADWLLTSIGALIRPRINTEFDMETLIKLIEIGVYVAEKETYWYNISRKRDRYSHPSFYLARATDPGHWFRFRLKEGHNGPTVKGLTQRELWRLAHVCNGPESAETENLSRKLQSELETYYREQLRKLT